MKIKELLQKYKNKKAYAVLLCVGILIMIAGSVVPSSKSTQKAANTNIGIDEKRLGSILESVEGAGKVRVFITYDQTEEKVPAADYRENISETNKTKEETVKGQGGELLVVKTVYPKIRGILVTATGACDTDTKNRLLKSVGAATGVSLSKIHIERAER